MVAFMKYNVSSLSNVTERVPSRFRIRFRSCRIGSLMCFRYIVCSTTRGGVPSFRFKRLIASAPSIVVAARASVVVDLIVDARF